MKSIHRIRLRGDEVSSCHLRSLVIVANTEGTLLAKTVSPEAVNGRSAGHVIMGEEKPETEDGLGEDVKDGVGDDFAVDIDVTGSISDTPDTEIDQLRFR